MIYIGSDRDVMTREGIDHLVACRFREAENLIPAQQYSSISPHQAISFLPRPCSIFDIDKEFLNLLIVMSRETLASPLIERSG